MILIGLVSFFFVTHDSFLNIFELCFQFFPSSRVNHLPVRKTSLPSQNSLGMPPDGDAEEAETGDVSSVDRAEQTEVARLSRTFGYPRNRYPGR